MKSGLRRLAAVRAQGMPVPLTRQPLLGLNALGLGRSDRDQLTRAYDAMGTVYSCVSLLAEATARSEWKLYKKQPQDARRRYAATDTGSDQRVEVTKHAALDLISSPNDFYTRQRLFEADQNFMELTGEWFWVLGRDGGMTFPTSIWPVSPARMEAVTDPASFITGWVYTSPDGLQKIPLSVDEVIQSALPNPHDPVRGLGPVQSILTDIDSARYSSEWNRTFFLNSAQPAGVITVPTAFNDDEFKQFSDRWRESHRGLNRAHSVAILEGGATWTPNQMSIRDMDFANLQNLDRDKVREVYRVHKVMLGVSDDVNRANAQTGEEIFAAWCVIPRLDRKKDVLNNRLLPMFGAAGLGVEFDYATPIPANREEDRQEMAAKAQAALFLVQAGYDPHDVLETIGLPDMDVAEKATQQPALPPGWMPGAPAPAPGAGQPAAGAEPSAAGAAQDDDMANRVRRMLSNGHIPVSSVRH